MTWTRSDATGWRDGREAYAVRLDAAVDMVRDAAFDQAEKATCATEHALKRAVEALVQCYRERPR